MLPGVRSARIFAKVPRAVGGAESVTDFFRPEYDLDFAGRDNEDRRGYSFIFWMCAHTHPAHTKRKGPTRQTPNPPPEDEAAVGAPLEQRESLLQ